MVSGPSFFLDGPSKDEIDAAIALARQWAVLYADPPSLVDNDDYSSKQWAKWAQQYALEAQSAATTITAYQLTTPYVLSLTPHETAPAIDSAGYFFALTAGTITEFHLGLLTAQTGGNTCKANLTVNGAVVASATIPNGSRVARVATNVAVAVDDIVGVACTDVGTGGLGLRGSMLLRGP
jgi:hypothetical protein